MNRLNFSKTLTILAFAAGVGTLLVLGLSHPVLVSRSFATFEPGSEFPSRIFDSRAIPDIEHAYLVLAAIGETNLTSAFSLRVELRCDSGVETVILKKNEGIWCNWISGRIEKEDLAFRVPLLDHARARKCSVKIVRMGDLDGELRVHVHGETRRF